MDFTLGSNAVGALEAIALERPEMTYRGPRAIRDSSELFSAILAAAPAGGVLLDLGCGPRDQAACAEHLGFNYVGVDYGSESADMLSDAHALAFGDATIDVVLSYAVLEHLYNPFIASAEVARVLKPGGLYVGTVSQGEPFHGSYLHHTSWGFIHVMQSAGLEVERLWDSYDTLHSLARIGRYHRVGKAMIEVVHRLIHLTPFLAPRRFLHASEREKQLDALHRASNVCFVVRKPEANPPMHA